MTSLRRAPLYGALFAMAGALLVVPAVIAQSTQSAATPASDIRLYDVVSIKPNKSGSGSMRMSSYDTTFTGENITLRWLMTNAFGVRDEQISGLPSWAGSQHWDMSAKIVDPDPGWKDRKQTREQSKQLYEAQLQAILRDRFQMKWHTETVIAPIYNLVVAKGGSKLKPITKEEEGHGGMSVNNQSLKATSINMEALASFLDGQIGRFVQDKTGLTGSFDIELKWSREDDSVNGTDNGSADKPPIIYTAVEEQLGLKLQPDKGPVQKIVVDSVSEPTPD